LSHIHRPGVSLGGRCIPVHPRLFLWNTPDATIVRAAREANATMPQRAVQRLEVEINSLDGLTVMIVGAPDWPWVQDSAFSGIFDLVESLEWRGATSIAHDPLNSDDEVIALGLAPAHKGDSADTAILHTGYEGYNDGGSSVVPDVRVILDGSAQVARDDRPDVHASVIGPARHCALLEGLRGL